jgi:hypothetical protein
MNWKDMTNDDFNEGKDLMRSDICVERVPERLAFRATLGFLKFGVHHPDNKNAKLKAYQALGDTEDEAVNNLMDIMSEHLLRLRKYEHPPGSNLS